MEELGSLAPLLIILFAFYLLLIRPARARARQQTQLQNSLAPGQEVMTASGLIATISAVSDDEVLLEVSPGVVLRWAKPGIARVRPADEDSDPAEAASPSDADRGDTSGEPAARVE